MTYELKDWLNSINMSKRNLLDEDPSAKFPAYIVNRCMSGQLDTVLFANEMNLKPNLDPKLQYSFYLNSVRKRKRFSPWLRKDEIRDLDYVKRYYGYSNEKAKQALSILTKQQLSFIKSKFETGGKR
jgi:hypothetical protein